MLVKENNPWLGLASYQSSDSTRFFGREREMAEISASIKDSECTILYGVSGVGKTSIINAGLCPSLANTGYLPITIRLNHKDGGSYGKQIIDACIDAFDNSDTECEYAVDADLLNTLDENEQLWIFFHASTFWSASNRKVTPVIFIDQFEELFTLTQNEESVQDFFSCVESIFSSIPSDKLIDALEQSGIAFNYNESPNFRLVMAMREDFLSRLEDYSYDIPILKKNRIGLRKMNGRQALEVITRPCQGLIDDEIALKIISAVSGKSNSGKAGMLDNIQIDTSLLSLFCSELYLLASDKRLDAITAELVESEGGDILNNFYEKNVSKLSRRGRRYIEQHLLTASGFRNQIAVEDIDRLALSSEEIAELESSRIIRKEIVNGTERIEFTHDILCKTAMESMRKHKDKQIQRAYGFSGIALFILGIGLAKLLTSFLPFFTGLRFESSVPSVILNCLGFIAIAMLFLPLCNVNEKRKYIVADICLIIYIIILALDLTTHLYRVRVGFSYQVWLLALTFIPVANLVTKAPRGNFKSYVQSMLPSSQLMKDKTCRIAILLVLCYFFLKLARALHLFGGRFNRTDIFLNVLFMSLCTVAIYRLIRHFAYPMRNDNADRKKARWLLIIQFALVTLYILSQFIPWRWVSALLLISLLGFTIYAEHQTLQETIKNRKVFAGFLYCSAILSLYLVPNYVLGFNILALGHNVRSNDRQAAANFITISSYGRKGIIEGNKIIVPTDFKQITCNLDNYDDDLFVTEKSLSRFQELNLRTIDIMPSFHVLHNGQYEEWNVLAHPEYNNKYTKRIPRLNEFGTPGEELSKYQVNYFYLSGAKDEFEKSSQRYFINLIRKYDYSHAYDSDIISTLHKLEKTTVEEFGHLNLDAILAATKDLRRSFASQSQKLRDAIRNTISDDMVYEQAIATNAILLMFEGNYDKAIEAAQEVHENATIIESLLLDDGKDVKDVSGIIEELASFVEDHGEFAGEVAFKDIGESPYLNSEKEGLLFAYANLIKPYVSTEKISDSKIVRKNHNNHVVILESGTIQKEYNKIVLPTDVRVGAGVYFLGDKRGFINSRTYEELTPPIFDHAWLFSTYNNLAVVEVDGLIGFIRKNGEYAVQPSIPMNPDLRNYIDLIFDKDHNLVFFDSTERTFGLLNENGDWIVKPIYDSISESNFGFRQISLKDGKTGLVNKHGKIILEPIYSRIVVTADTIKAEQDGSDTVESYSHNGINII